MSFVAWITLAFALAIAVAVAITATSFSTPTPPPKPNHTPARMTPQIPKPDVTIHTNKPSAQIVWASENVVEHVRDRRVRVVLSPGEDWTAVSIPSDVEVEQIIEPEGANFTKTYLMNFPETYHGDLAVAFVNNKTSKPFRLVWNPNAHQVTAKPFVVSTSPPKVIEAVTLPASAWAGTGLKPFEA